MLNVSYCKTSIQALLLNVECQPTAKRIRTFCYWWMLLRSVVNTFRSVYCRTSRRTVVSDWRDDSTKWLDRTSFFRVRCTSFHIHSPLLSFFLCFIVLFQSCCSHVQVFGKTLVHEFPIFYSHPEWNLFSSGTNTLLWWRACYQKLN